MKKNLNILLVGLAVLSMSSCKSLYGKYERPDVKTAGLVRDSASLTDTLAVTDTTSFANIPCLPTPSCRASSRRDWPTTPTCSTPPST